MSGLKGRLKRDGRLGGFLPCLIAAVCVMVATVALTALVASLVSLAPGVTGIYSLVALILSAIIAGAVGAKICGDGGRIKITLLCPFAVVLIMLLVSVVMGGVPTLSGLMNYLCYMGAYILASIVARPGKGHKRRKRR